TSMALCVGGMRSMSCVTVLLLRRYCLVLVMYDTLCADTYLGGVTMLRRVSVLALALALAACDRGADDGGPSYTDVREAKIHILAGDGQVAPVATSPERAGDLALRLQGGSVEEAYDLFPDVLEVWVGAGMRLLGEPVAAGTDVHWIVRDEGCGRPVGQTTSTDADGRAVNRWIRGTRARECHMDVCRIL